MINPMSDLENISLSEQEPVRALIARAIKEDIRTGDVTTNAIIDKKKRAKAIWQSKEGGIIAGLDLANFVYRKLDAQLEWVPHFEDGDYIEAGTEIVEMKGSCRAILSAERIALNIAQRMSGIASMTHRFVTELKGTSVSILDTRKTVPGLRLLDKYAVVLGGGDNHRMGLFDLALIKDNHITAAGGIDRAVQLVRAENPNMQIEVETSTLDQVKEALSEGVDIIMLDNMSIELMKEAVMLIDGKAITEASGNITLERIRQVAETGVDCISVGALTHSVKAFDISQKLQKLYN
jgi:nicotinate-nucleotide pyrophosphorylase (carboxylating)